MDAPDDDQDIRVQKASSELLADLQLSLTPFLWKTPSSGKRQIRRRVRVKETDRLVGLLEPFQELPQLLDPHLDRLVPVLADAFLDFSRAKRPSASPHTQFLIPLSKAICRLLYTFCKIRGEKVIVRFLSTEIRHLELLLSAIEVGDHTDGNTGVVEAWEWEERYITLLWLSQLLLVPFDLSTISSTRIRATQADTQGLRWPPNVPGLTHRVVSLAIQYLSSSGRERDAAKILLVRIAMRRDMQALGLLRSLVEWATSQLRLPSAETSSYRYIGLLSFLAGLLNSSLSTSDMDPYLSDISGILQTESFVTIVQSSVVARKTSIKVLRAISSLVLRQSNSTEMVESTISILFESLADAATPVRLAASKAMSVITLKLTPDMARQVVEEVLASLKRNVIDQDLSGVNPSEWHGLILTLSQLLYRRSPPASTLAEILPALLTGLSFEQRSTSGSSVGTNVRDAACFGIWALARRYTSSELQAIHIDSNHKNSSTIQVLATELVVSASADPAGNIRRGSSAALQELIGRHPNTIAEGIPLVQVVDYHAVALRSRAASEVAVQAAKLSDYYMTEILEALLGWRGVGDGDASARKITSSAFGGIICSGKIPSRTIDQLEHRLRELKPRQDDERHGLILCVASLIENLGCSVDIQLKSLIAYVLESAKAPHRRMDLIAEAVSRLVLAACSCSPPERQNLFLDHQMIIDALDLFSKWLRRNEPEVIEAASSAMSSLFPLLDTVQQCSLVADWVGIALAGRDGQDKAILSSLFKVFPSVRPLQADIIHAILGRWNSAHDIETRTIILRYLATGEVITSNANDFISIISNGLNDYTTNARGDVGSLVRIEAVKAVRMMPQEFVVKIYGKVLRLAAEKLDKVRTEAQQAVVSGMFKTLPISSEEYFRTLLDMQTRDYLAFPYQQQWGLELFEGYVGSAATGAEDLVQASRAALVDYCEGGNVDLVGNALFQVLKMNIANDRILVPTLEVIGFLFDVQIIQQTSLNWRSLYLLVQKAHFKTGNVRKLEAAIRLYSGLVEVLPEASEKLVAMLLHPFPRIRNQVVDTLFAVRGVGKGVNWLKADRADLQSLRKDLDIIVV